MKMWVLWVLLAQPLCGYGPECIPAGSWYSRAVYVHEDTCKYAQKARLDMGVLAVCIGVGPRS